MKIKVTEHGKYLSDTLNSTAPIVFCPECGEMVQRVKVKKYDIKRWYGYRALRYFSTTCSSCGCKFEGEELGERKVALLRMFGSLGIVNTLAGILVLVVGMIGANPLGIGIGFASIMVGPAIASGCFELEEDSYD